MSSRHIHSHLSSRQVPELLQSLFVAELLSPSQCLWIISPWISDIPIIDNTANFFLCLNPLWGRKAVPFSEVLSTLAEQGTTIHIATRPDSHNQRFQDKLNHQITGKEVGVQCHIQEELHSKGILGDHFYLAGSMNFTFNGITLNEESLTYEIDSNIIAEQQLIFQKRWGGVLA